jgi:hypothetical protein
MAHNIGETTMRPSLVFPAAAALALAGCMAAEAPTSGEFRTVTSEAEFRELTRNGLRGERFDVVYGPSTWQTVVDGNVTASGTWAWRDGQWCRQGQMANGNPVPLQCQTIQVRGTEMRTIRPDGTSEIGRLTI